MANEQEKSGATSPSITPAKGNVTNDKPQMPARGATPYYEVKVDDVTGEEKIVTGNFTRDSIVQFQKGKFMELGKTDSEATELAVKRGYEMVKDPPAAK